MLWARSRQQGDAAVQKELLQHSRNVARNSTDMHGRPAFGGGRGLPVKRRDDLMALFVDIQVVRWTSVGGRRSALC